jgi:hypothetical protein
MKIKNIIKTALLAFASLALFSTTSRAAGLTVVDGDVFLGFSNPSASFNLVIKVGVLSGYTDGSLGVLNHTFTIGNYASSLSSAFGAGWASDSTLTYTAFGGDFNTSYLWAVSQKTATPAPAIDQGTGNNFAANTSGYLIANYANGTENIAGKQDFKESTTASGSFVSYMSDGSNSGPGFTWAALPAANAQSGITSPAYLDIYNFATNGDGSAPATAPLPATEMSPSTLFRSLRPMPCSASVRSPWAL